MINYVTLYRAHGIRRINQLLSPPFGKTVDFSFPKDSVFHYIPQGGSEVGPASNEILLRLTKNQINVEHIRTLESNTSKARPFSKNIETDIRHWHTRNRRFRLVRAIETAFKDPNTLVICNYGFLNKGYVFPKVIGGPYHQWYDAQFTLFKNINRIAELAPRQQYFVTRLPKIIPSQGVLRKAQSASNVQALLKLFPNDEAKFIFELWKWFGSERESSLFKQIDPKNLNKVNLIFVESGSWFVLNLGLVNSWRKATKEELEINPDLNKEGMEADVIQRRFLALLLAAMEVRTVTGDLIETDSESPVSDKTDDPEEAQEHPTILSSLPPVTNNNEVILNSEDVLQEPDDKGSDYKHDAFLETKIEQNLEVLEKINEVHEVDETVVKEEVEPLPSAPTHESGVKIICEKLAQQGLLSANEFKRFTTLSEKFKGIVAPNGKDTLESFINVSKELIALPEEQLIPDHPAIVDKTMINSSLQKFDSHYVENILERDIASMVVGVQKAGIAVTDYETEDVVDISNNYRMYSVRVAPVEGVASTLRFRIPIVNKDGSFLAGGVKYTLRKQRGDGNPQCYV